MRVMAILISLCSIFVLSSCGWLYGVHQPALHRKLSKQDLPVALQNCPLTFPDSAFLQRITTYTSDTNFKHDLKQPLQLWIFEDGRLVANTVNCYATGFPNLKWQLTELYQKQIRSTIFANGAPPDKAVFEKLFGVAIPAQGKAAIIVSSQFMGRQNKRFLKAVAALKQQVGFDCFTINMDALN